VLQLALKSVWLHAFDENLKGAVEQLYDQVVERGDLNSTASMPPLDAINDVAPAQGFPSGACKWTSSSSCEPVPTEVLQAFPTSGTIWASLSDGQRFYVYPGGLVHLKNADQPDDQKNQYKNNVAGHFSKARMVLMIASRGLSLRSVAR